MEQDSGMGHIANRITMSIVMCLILSTCSQTNTSVSSPEGGVGRVASSLPPGSTSRDSDNSNSDSAGADSVRVASEDQTLALDHTTNAPLKDAFAPSVMPDRPMGQVGYTRYVFSQSGDQVIPALIEGPRAEQTRCQKVELPCSFEELKDLRDSGIKPPDELNMSVAELDVLIRELSEVRATLVRFADVNDACAAGYRPDGTQTPNMGSHFTNFQLVIDGKFSPSAPEILLYVAADDETPPFGALGRCKKGVWRGVDVEIAGAAFYMPFAAVGDDHFEGFSGPLDNWHVHYNLCRLAGQDVTVLPSVCSGLSDGPIDRPQGDASDGWMIHAWADSGHDNQLGAFSMWNPAIWPKSDPTRAADLSIGSRTTSNTNLISNFDYQVVESAVPGKISFFNADPEAHSITAGTPEKPSGEFDSGVVGGGAAAVIEISQPGTYEFFCSLHPGMTGSIVVGEG